MPSHAARADTGSSSSTRRRSRAAAGSSVAPSGADAGSRAPRRTRPSSAGQRGIHVLGQLAQEGLLCLGPREGRQPTFVLLDDWIPRSRDLPREEALAVLATRYFASHGPATLQDFTWWSGLTMVVLQALAHLAAECYR